jgi:hypothetical protein
MIGFLADWICNAGKYRSGPMAGASDDRTFRRQGFPTRQLRPTMKKAGASTGLFFHSRRGEPRA